MPQGFVTLPTPSVLSNTSNPKSLVLSNLVTGFAKRVRFKKGETIYSAGEKFINLYFVVNGFVKADHSFDNGSYHTHRFIIPGDCFGLMGLGTGLHQSNTTALTECDLLAVNTKVFMHQLSINREMRDVFEAVRSDVLNQANRLSLILSTYSVERRLAHFLIDFQKRLTAVNRDYPSIDLPMSREDLKNHLGMTTESLSRAFSNLEKSGCFNVQNRLISEIDFELLQKVVDREQ